MLYDEALFEYVDRNALRSANGVLPLLHQVLDVQRVLDVGCGHGAWLAAGVTWGVENVTGIDGGRVDTAQLQFLRDRFMAHIFEKIFDLARCFDLIQSLEVAEQLPQCSAGGFVAIDYLRPLMNVDTTISPCYRYELFLYACRERLESLPAAVRRHRIPGAEKLEDIFSFGYKLRNMLEG